MALTIWVPAPWLAALSLLVFGAGADILWVVSTAALRQAVTPRGCSDTFRPSAF